ncbi:MAG: tetratricopeptide repeat protein [Prochlorotrichaceae cyanobacterium]
MTEKRRRLLINIFLVISLLSFVGLTIAPLLSTALRREEPIPTAQPSASPGLPQDQKAVLEEQAKSYEVVLQREPENQTALRGLLELRLQLQDIPGAIVPLEKLATLNPQDSTYALLLAQAKQQVNDREGAAEAYRKLLSSNPGNLDALQGLVGLLLQQNRPEAALGLLQDTLKLAEQANADTVKGASPTPNAIDVIAVQLILGQVYAEQGRFDEAIAVYDDIALQDAADFRPLLAKAIVLKTQGKTKEAEPLLESAAALAPSQYKDQINQLLQESSPSPSSSPSAATPESPSPATESSPEPTASPEGTTSP